MPILIAADVRDERRHPPQLHGVASETDDTGTEQRSSGYECAAIRRDDFMHR